MNRRPPPDNQQMFNISDTSMHKCFASLPHHSVPPPPQFDIKKCLKKNVFIDSYYPKLGGYSDGSRITSCDEVHDSWDTSTNGTYTPNSVPKRSTTLACPTIDSRTYTLQSCSSDLDSTFVNPSGLPCNTSGMSTPKKKNEIPPEISSVGCFTQLYHHIHNLEKLLQQTLIKSKQDKCEKPRQMCGPTGGGEATEEKDNSDTDNELLSIKKRLQVLEEKLRSTKQSLAKSLTKSPRDEPESSGSAHRCCVRLSNQETIFPQELYLSSRDFLEISCSQKPKTKIKKKFIAKCRGMKRRCSSILSSSVRSSAKSPLKVSNISEWGEVLYKRSILTEESLVTTLRSFSTKTDSSNVTYLSREERRRKKKFKRKLCKKSSVTNFLPLKHRHSVRGIRTSPLAFGDCNINRSDSESNPNILTLRDFNGCPPAWTSVPPSAPLKRFEQDPPSPNHSPQESVLPSKSNWKQFNSRNPLEILKRGGKIKIPVLFEEVCKTSNSEDISRKLSHVSMRFVVVEEDKHPLTPLRKLINKLYQSKPQNGGEQFVFGVTRCHCDCQVGTEDKIHVIERVQLTGGRILTRERQFPAGDDGRGAPVVMIGRNLGGGEDIDYKRRNKVEREFSRRNGDLVIGVYLREDMRTQRDGQQLPGGLTYLHIPLLAIILLLLYHRWQKRNFYKMAAVIPGPKPLPLIGNAMEYLALDHVKILDYLLDITTKYNGLARVWLGGLLLVHVSRPEDVEILLSSSKVIEKNRMYRFFDDVLGQGLLNARGDVWRKHRKIIAPTFHPSILKHFVKIFSEQSKILVKVLEKNADGRIFNVFPYVRNCALDFITETALENHIGAQLRVVAPATRAAERLMNITYNRMFKLWLYSDFIFYRTQQGREYLRLRDLVKESTEPLLEVKKKEVAEGEGGAGDSAKRRSFFRQLVELNKDGETFTDKELRDEVVTMIITGYETTAATVGFILVALGIHQDIQDKVYEEVKAMQEFLKGRDLEADDLTRFEYMDRVIKETLRLYPVGPIIFRECTSDLKLTTCTIPKGASVAVVILKMHRDPAIWENPEKFDPDHFLPERCEKRHPYAYIPFSAGPRNCIGKQYAYLSMRVMLYHILSEYRVLCDLQDSDIRIKSEVTMKMVGGFKIRLVRREGAQRNYAEPSE